MRYACSEGYRSFSGATWYDSTGVVEEASGVRVGFEVGNAGAQRELSEYDSAARATALDGDLNDGWNVGAVGFRFFTW